MSAPRTTTSSAVWAAGAALLALAAAWTSVAQRARATLRTGFVPDPVIVEGTARGERPASELDAACEGFVSRAPSHVYDVATRIGFLRLFATGPGDLVIVVRTPRGEVWCNDDRFATHPSVEGIVRTGEGPLEIYVGTHDADAECRYSLFLTETRSVRPGIGRDERAEASAALGEDVGLDTHASAGAHGGIRLRRGFLPDPRVLSGEAGGPVDASLLGGSCRGRLANAPSHTLELREEFDFLQLYIDPRETSDPGALSVVVMRPDGTFVCDVQRAADVPDVSAASWAPGLYRVWIGVDEEGATRAYHLGISEIRRVR